MKRLKRVKILFSQALKPDTHLKSTILSLPPARSVGLDWDHALLS